MFSAVGGPRTWFICLSIDGTERWRIRSTAECTVPWLAWDVERVEWVALEFDYGARRRDSIVRIAATGEVTGRFEIAKAMDYAFDCGGSRLSV